MIPISEIFTTIQGEGPRSGVPSLFIRTYFCTLGCSWCDSKYTWQDQRNAKAGVDYREVSPESLAGRILDRCSPNVVFTGGEPMIHQRELMKVIGLVGSGVSRFRGYRPYYEVETSGTIEPIRSFEDAVDSFNVSLKLRNSGNIGRIRLRPSVIRRFVALANRHRAWFKFVITDRMDIDEVDELVRMYDLPRDKVLLMPEGTSPEVLTERGKWLVEICKEKGYRFTTRLHIFLFGNRRGV